MEVRKRTGGHEVGVIPQIEPWIGEEELRQLAEVVESTWLIEGDKTNQFETKFAELVGCRHAVTVNNATAGLYCCLKALGVGAGHEVIIPDLTFIATANAVIWAEATPVLADIDENTFNIDPTSIEEKISSRTRALMPVHLYGQSADMEAIMAIAERHGLVVVEDAAQGVGVKFGGRHVGGWGAVGCFSFYGNKTITTGQGGMITTDDEQIRRKCLILKNHGRTERGTFIHHHIGYNFCFTDLQAALGLAQLTRLDHILRRKRKILELYMANLADLEAVRFPTGDPRCDGVPWFTNILVDDPEALGTRLREAGVGTRRFFHPLHLQPCYRGRWPGEFPTTDRVYQQGLSLPSSATLTEDQIVFVCQEINSFFGI
jgi:perosamine synthetase